MSHHEISYDLEYLIFSLEVSSTLQAQVNQYPSSPLPKQLSNNPSNKLQNVFPNQISNNPSSRHQNGFPNQFSKTQSNQMQKSVPSRLSNNGGIQIQNGFPNQVSNNPSRIQNGFPNQVSNNPSRIQNGFPNQEFPQHTTFPQMPLPNPDPYVNLKTKKNNSDEGKNNNWQRPGGFTLSMYLFYRYLKARRAQADRLEAERAKQNDQTVGDDSNRTLDLEMGESNEEHQYNIINNNDDLDNKDYSSESIQSETAFSVGDVREPTDVINSAPVTEKA